MKGLTADQEIKARSWIERQNKFSRIDLFRHLMYAQAIAQKIPSHWKRIELCQDVTGRVLQSERRKGNIRHIYSVGGSYWCCQWKIDEVRKRS